MADKFSETKAQIYNQKFIVFKPQPHMPKTRGESLILTFLGQTKIETLFTLLIKRPNFKSC